MEIFQRAKVVRLRSHHDKYLLADEDEETVHQDRNGCYKNAKWNVEIVENANVVRFKSCYGKYLTASNLPFIFGSGGKKVLQTLPRRLDSSLEWEPIREGVQVRLRTRYGQFLRANGGLPPWRNSITHDIPFRNTTQDWILWDVDVVEIRQQQAQQPPKQRPRPTPITTPDRSGNPTPMDTSASVSDVDNFSKIELRSPRPIEVKEDSDDSVLSPKKEGRTIFYDVGDENGDVDPSKEKFFTFMGSSVNELKEKLKEETGRDDILVCSRNPLNGKLYLLRLQLPPNNSDMHVIVVPSSFKGESSSQSKDARRFTCSVMIESAAYSEVEMCHFPDEKLQGNSIQSDIQITKQPDHSISCKSINAFQVGAGLSHLRCNAE